jgi:hypothetical protein
MNDAAPRLCGHWLHRLSSKDKAGIDGCVMHDNRVELGAAFGRFCLRSTASGMSLVGTKRTNGEGRLESAFGGRAEVGFRGREGRC